MKDRDKDAAEQGGCLAEHETLRWLHRIGSARSANCRGRGSVHPPTIPAETQSEHAQSVSLVQFGLEERLTEAKGEEATWKQLADLNRNWMEHVNVCLDWGTLMQQSPSSRKATNVDSQAVWALSRQVSYTSPAFTVDYVDNPYSSLGRASYQMRWRC